MLHVSASTSQEQAAVAGLVGVRSNARSVEFEIFLYRRITRDGSLETRMRYQNFSVGGSIMYDIDLVLLDSLMSLLKSWQNR
jgi:hypothetical protein